MVQLCGQHERESGEEIFETTLYFLTFKYLKFQLKSKKLLLKNKKTGSKISSHLSSLIKFNFELGSQKESLSDYMDAGNDYALNDDDDDTIILELEK